MATQTTHYNLTKPDLTDLVDVTVLNDNADIIDDAIYAASQYGGAAMIESSVEATTTSAHAYAVGDHFIYNNTLYAVTAAIAVGDTITPESNCVATNVMAEVEAGGGTSDYTQLSNKPQINGHTLTWNQTGAQLGLVDAVSGKGLSSNDYTTAEKEKLEDIAAGAEANVQSDWNQADSTADDYIKNRTHYAVPAWTQKISADLHPISGESMRKLCGQGTAGVQTLTNGKLYKVTLGTKVWTGYPTKYTWTAYEYAYVLETDIGLAFEDNYDRTWAGWKAYITTGSADDLYAHLTIEENSGENVTKLDNKYLDMDSAPASGSAKPVTSGGLYTALTGKISTTEKGVANGVASLDANGKVPSTQMPAGSSIPSGGTTGQVLKKKSNTDYDTEWANESGGGGTSDYTDLTNKPQINGHTLTGNKTGTDLGLVNAVTGKQLSTEDYTTEEKTKLSGIEAQANKTVIDSTLTNTGEAADAKAVGDEISDVRNTLNSEIATRQTYVRPNLLDNWYFGNPVNQRGYNTYSGAGYTIDRWEAYSDPTFAKANTGWTLTPGSMQYCRIVQKIEGSVFEKFDGKLTFSALISSVTANVFYIEVSYFDANNTQKYVGHKSISQAGITSTTISVPSDADFTKPFWFMVSQAGTAAGSVTINSLKLELGSGQTLAHNEGTDANPVWVLNEVPDYATELLRCTSSHADASDKFANKDYTSALKVGPRIESGDDLDNYHYVYQAGTYAIANGITNSPENWSAILVIPSSSGGCRQLVFGANRIYMRSYSGSPLAWSQWKLITFS